MEDEYVDAATALIRRITTKIGIPDDVRIEATRLFITVFARHNLNQGSNTARSCACIMVAAKNTEDVQKMACLLTTMPKITEEFKDRMEEVVRFCANDSTELTSDHFMSRLQSLLQISDDVTSAATMIARRAVFRIPISVPAAAVFMASQVSSEKRSMKQVADVLRISEATVKEAYGDIYAHAARLFPEEHMSSEPLDSLPSP
uniref:TFIIB domain-containing protein n=1 Tax=Caenorhabditis japonica TaxID=281687 RepID=A0A8R1DZT6_CAEJA